MKQLLLDIAPPETLALDHFVIGRNTEMLAGLCELTRKAPAERFVYLWGGRGCGKTHLLRALCNSGLASAYLGRDQHTHLRADLDEFDLVAVDDVESLQDPEQIALFDLYNRIREQGGRLVVAGDRPPAALVLRPELSTRLAWGLVYHVHPLSDEEKRDALIHRARRRGYELKVDVAQYLLTHASRDMPSLLALLDTLDRYSLETHRPMTVQLLRELLVRPAGYTAE